MGELYEEDKVFIELTKSIKGDDDDYYLFLLKSYQATNSIDLVRDLIEDRYSQNKGNNFKGNV